MLKGNMWMREMCIVWSTTVAWSVPTSTTDRAFSLVGHAVHIGTVQCTGTQNSAVTGHSYFCMGMDLF